jgi:predicted transcriptional regulator
MGLLIGLKGEFILIMSSFSDGYQNFIKSSPGYGSVKGAEYVKTVEAGINKLKEDINQFNGFGTASDKLKGDVAEFWHSGTHNIDAAVKDVKARTSVDRNNTFASSDISSNFNKKFGVKYYKDGVSSAKAQSTSYFQRYMEYKAETNSNISFSDFLKQRNISENDVLMHDPIYHGQIRIIPKEQLEAAQEFLKRKIAEETNTRPELVKKYQETLEMLEIKIKSNQGSESIALTEKEARKLAELAKKGEFDPAEYGLTTEELIKFKYIMQQSLKAGLSAATISMVLKIVPELYKIIDNLIKTGEISIDDIKNTGFVALSGGAEGFLRGSISAGITIACLSGQFGTVLKSVDPTIIGAVTVIALNTIQNSYKVARGKMTKEEFTDACMRDLFVTTCSLVLGSVTQGFIEIPVLGYLIGSFIGSIAASFIYDTAYKTFLSFCCETGFTFFGLVDQNYELPIGILKKMGIKVIEYKKFSPKKLDVQRLNIARIKLSKIKLETLEITFIRRGVIGVNKIGYV